MNSAAERPRVAYQGAPGAFGEEAVARYWGGRAEAVGVPSFAAAVDSLAAGAVQFAVLPVWNSTIGRLDDACAAVERGTESIAVPVRSIGQITLRIRHYLLARPAVRKAAIQTVLGHPAALAQCAAYLAAHRLVALATGDSASAAAALAGAREDEPFTVPGLSGTVDPRAVGVIASAAAAARYGLAILAGGVQDRPDNRTSFLVLEAGPAG
ncbi:MAG TPA: prephenate dehydratase domain-containing protein [Gemmatimonadaceae bacterium]|nr:prephenate dehydratase domain-containing protein [Gemmatimonadaceae bacterium]